MQRAFLSTYSDAAAALRADPTIVLTDAEVAACDANAALAEAFRIRAWSDAGLAMAAATARDVTAVAYAFKAAA